MPQNTAFDTILVQSRDLFRDRLCEAVTAMLDACDAALTEASDKSSDDELKKRYVEARDIMLANRDVIESQFRQRLISEFQKRSNKVKKVGATFSDFSLDDLALVGEDDLEDTLKFNDLAARVRRYCEEELSALDQRVGVLLGDANLESDDNPFGPKVICDAYKTACQKTEAPLPVRMVFLKLFDDHVADTIRSSYKEVNELLVDNGILPKIRYGISKSESKDRPAGLPPLDEAKPEAAPVDPQDMFAQLAKMMGGAMGAGGGAPGMGVGGIPVMQGAELMSSLSQLQVGNLAALGEAAAELGPILAEAGNLKNVLHKLKETSVGGSMGQVDAMTLDVVAMLFDELFEDPKIPIALKGLIGRLQLPMLKVAIADKELFTKKTHPARQLLDVLGQIGVRLPPEFDSENPLFPRLEKFIQELVDGFQEKMEIFDKVRAELEAIISEDDKRVEKEHEATTRELEQKETLAVATAAAQEEIRKRIAGAQNIPRPIVRFLALQWIKYLVIVRARDGKDSEGWKTAVDTMDQLLVSIAPKNTIEDRRALARTIPSLLKNLKAGVANGGIDDAVSAQFFSELMKTHAELMHTAPAAAAAKAATDTATSKPVADTLTKKPVSDTLTKKPVADTLTKKPVSDTLTKKPVSETLTKKPVADTVTKKPVAKVVVEEELDFTAPVEINNPFGEGKVSVSSEDLDFTAQPEAIVAPSAPVAAAPSTGAAPPAPPAAADKEKPAKRRDTIRLPSAMIVGAWVDVLDQDGATHLVGKLHYVSPMKSHFLFVDRQGKKIYECSRSMLARRLKLGEVTMLDGEPDSSLFDRIMGGLFGKLKSKGVSVPVPA